MKPFTVWIRKTTTIIIGGEGDKPVPVITGELVNPQIKIDPEKGTITITETK